MHEASDNTSLETIENHESSVRSYSRAFPAVFTRARGHVIEDEHGHEYIDFFAGAGALNYGHNDPQMKACLLEYIEGDGITHSLDMATQARSRFLQRFREVILEPRGLDYRVMFPGPTGTNAVEAALKIARKVTGRPTVMSFTNAFHGMTLGSLAVSGNAAKRAGAGTSLDDSVFIPFNHVFGEDGDSLDFLETMITSAGSGVDHPAAVIVETVQGEGGINTADIEWLQRLEKICRDQDILLIVDDVQAGCGRTGPFFSFEAAGIAPDIVCLSKSISGYGLPLALTLIRPEHDCLSPGEHNGTFRGHNPALLTATAALDYWETDELQRDTERKGVIVGQALADLAASHPVLGAEVRGRGLMQGLAVEPDGLSEAICARAFEQGLIVETSGPRDEVVKLLPPLTIDEAGLRRGLDRLHKAVAAAVAEYRPTENAA